MSICTCTLCVCIWEWIEAPWRAWVVEEEIVGHLERLWHQHLCTKLANTTTSIIHSLPSSSPTKKPPPSSSKGGQRKGPTQNQPIRPPRTPPSSTMLALALQSHTPINTIYEAWLDLHDWTSMRSMMVKVTKIQSASFSLACTKIENSQIKYCYCY